MDLSASGPTNRRTDDERALARRSASRPEVRAVLGEGPGAALRALPISGGQDSGAPADRPIRGEPSHNLPHSLTSFIGRTSEIAAAGRLLSRTRLLTLTGAGGVGKTRLGHAVAARQRAAFRDGVWLVQLGALADARLVPRAVAGVLGVREEAEQPLTETLADTLSADALLLVLDNCEHLVEACAALAEALLGACPELRILATSRQALGIAGETAFRVPSLALTAGNDAPSVVDSSYEEAHPAGADPPASSAENHPATATSEAVSLFVERARAAVPAFTLTDRNAAVVEQICRRLDGIPLAIELAAARIAVLSPEQIAARLHDRFHLLSGGSRTALPRYRTLRALVDWSHALLTEPEQVLLRRLAVFAGGWSLEAAESISAGADLASDDVLDLLSGLVEKSLVLTVEQAGEVHYRFLESLREYAAEKLRDAGEESLLRDRHGAWHLALAERAEPELTGPHQEAWLNRLDRERENLRAAQRWALERGDVETVARLGAALWHFWWVRADAADAREWVNAIVPLAGQMPPIPALARALRGAGLLAGALADYATCRSLLGEGLAIARQLDDRGLLASLLDSLGRQSFVEARYSEARALLNEGLAIFREIDDRNGLARALSHLGFLDYLENRQEAARAAYREGLAVARDADDPDAVAEFFDNLGRTFHAEGDFDGAIRAYQEAEAIWREIGQGPRLAMVLNNLGSVHTLRGELGTARAQLAEALSLAQRIGNRRRQAFTLAAISTLAAVAGEAERAVRLDAIASAAVAEMGASLAQPIHALGVQHLERARQALGASGSPQVAGRATSLAQGVEEALAWLAALGGSAQVGGQPAHQEAPLPTAVPPVLGVTQTQTRSGTGSLSPRELEVAALIARGMTNRQIAAELVITEGTAANHVKHILARLTLDSRVQIATWAIERGLHLASPS